MPASTLRKRQGLPNIARIPLPERVVPPFHRRCLASLFAHAAMRLDRKYGGLRGPNVTATGIASILFGNSVPQAPTGAFTMIADHEGHNLPGSPTPHRPQPLFPGALTHKRPHLLDFQPVIGLRWLQGRLQRRSRLDFFLIQSASVFRDTPKLRLLPRILGRS